MHTLEKVEASEQDTVQATISIKALMVAWLSIPMFYIIPYLFVYIPRYLKMKISGEIEQALQEAINIGQKASVVDVVKQDIFGSISPIFMGIVEFFIGLLFFAWLCWAVGYTIKHFKYKLFYDQKELFGKAGNKEIRIPLEKIDNIFIEDSIWGKLLNYGTITVTSSLGSISVKNVSGARKFIEQLANVSIKKEK
ncbi:MAG: hypothetical protein E7348_04670 [Clostridiales bacterium]|nr:hypothetical protein [Clostridiales bacterium]